jgi:hypothetical protein
VTARIKAGLWVKALIRRVSVQGGAAFLSRKGDDDAGEVVLVLNGLKGQSRLLVPAMGPNGDRRWLMVSGADPKPDADIAQDLAQRAARDPDLWVVEIEDADYRAFVDDPIDIVSPSLGSVRNPVPGYPGPRR